jgi:hypothetical protein
MNPDLLGPMDPAEVKAMDLAVLRLQRRFPDRPIERIRDEVRRAHHDYDRARIRGFVSILVERDVAETLEHHRPVAS